ncbi:hypothetical protein PV325_005617 [Microctonus aethiopoides]|uniref:phospholipase A2 n=1 Tax=Microctonus aethiopoides TaxID=144406 RepID=A0AA39F1L5_9HYME|nr:hypothetical protein PV325_005617 [Microctonus aethiopoides]KAK0160693.1 hypothetical protein PV328_008077 [Microctonus aethiopoides]
MYRGMFDLTFKHSIFVDILLGLFLFLNIAEAYSQYNNDLIVNATVTIDDFVITRITPDGAIQRRINYQGICAIETIVDWGATTVTLREITLNKKRKRLQLIYEGDTLTDCMEKKLIDGKNNICRQNNDDNFWTGDVIEKFETFKNVDKDYQLSQPSSELMWWLNSTNDLVRECHRMRSVIRNQLLKQHFQQGTMNNDYSLYEERKNSTEILKKKHGNDNRNKNRRRRRELFLMPGTQWCGRGSRATKYTNLGGFSKADACCRKHDTACPFYIPAFESRYGLFNLGITTLMHCTCDERFRACLKMARTSSANLIGKIFFDYTQTKCFILKPNKVCLRTSWWGKCERYKYRKQAILRKNIAYSRG